MASEDPANYPMELEYLHGTLDALRNLYMSACANKKYYSHRLTRVQRSNTAYEIVLAIGTSGAVAAWPVWQSEIAKPFWVSFVGVIAVLVIVKPILQLSSRIQRYSKLYAGWDEFFYGLHCLLAEHRIAPSSYSRLIRSFQDANKHLGKLQKDGDPQQVAKLLERCRAEARQEALGFSDLPLPLPDLRPKDRAVARRASKEA